MLRICYIFVDVAENRPISTFRFLKKLQRIWFQKSSFLDVSLSRKEPGLSRAIRDHLVTLGRRVVDNIWIAVLAKRVRAPYVSNALELSCISGVERGCGGCDGPGHPAGGASNDPIKKIMVNA